MKKLKIAIFLAYGGESHLYWASQIKKNSVHEVQIFTMPPRHWKWRMQGSAGYFANLVNNYSFESFDIFLLTSMTNVSSFKGFLDNKNINVPIYTYFHENQFAYPVSLSDPDRSTERLEHYQFIQIQSLLSSDRVFFNSKYNKDTFLTGAKKLLKKVPDFKDFYFRVFEKELEIWPLYIDPSDFSNVDKNENEVIFIWNHRWDYDKNPQEFFDILLEFKKKKSFGLIVCGKEIKSPVFENAKDLFHKELIHWGYCENRKDYLKLLSRATHSIVTSNHDFFGLSAFECLLSGVKTYFPKRLCYPDHFQGSEYNNIFYKDESDIIAKLSSHENYPHQIFRHVLSRFDEFLDLNV